jgi:hypothetical protein
VRSFPKALDVADELHLYGLLPARAHAKVAAEPIVISWLVAEDAGRNIVSEDLRRF